MMTGNLLRISNGKLGFSPSMFLQLARNSSTTAAPHPRARIGNREVVGYGINGQYNYIDHVNNPFPAVRFKESTPDIQVKFWFGLSK